MKKIDKKLHFLGIGGISQSAIALIFKSLGYFVSGSDRTKSAITEKLELGGVPVCINGVSSYIKDADIIVVSAAIHEDDKELQLAKSLNKKIISRAKMLGTLASKYGKVISVAGSHGKTTTTGMLAEIFIHAGLNPTVHVGGELDNISGNVHIGNKDYFITEACEYVDSFLELKSDISVILNIQPDHLDYFKTFDKIDKSFTKFASHTKKGGLVVYLADDPCANKKYKTRNISYSINGNGIIEARNIKEYEKGKYKFDCYFLGVKLIKIRLGVYGVHNVYNALASICVALEEGIDIGVIKEALYNFKGAKRRFEDYGYYKGARLIHDYAHHPTEIKATIALAKRITSGNLYVVFQPHTFSRTKLLLDGFKSCFTGAKEVFVYKVYPAREREEDGINEKELARQLSLSGQKAFSFEDYIEMKNYIDQKLSKKDTLLVLGAGDIEDFAKMLGGKN